MDPGRWRSEEDGYVLGRTVGLCYSVLLPLWIPLSSLARGYSHKTPSQRSELLVWCADKAVPRSKYCPWISWIHCCLKKWTELTFDLILWDYGWFWESSQSGSKRLVSGWSKPLPTRLIYHRRTASGHHVRNRSSWTGDRRTRCLPAGWAMTHLTGVMFWGVYSWLTWDDSIYDGKDL